MSNLEVAFRLLDVYVRENMRATGAPGMALALTDRERLLGIQTYGYADLASQKPITPETLFEIGSVTKSFTALLLLQEWEGGRLDLEVPIDHYLPWFRVQSSYDPITPHHLLSHTGGIICGSEFSTEARGAVWALRDTITGAPPGTFFHYSNDGYKVLGLVLEALVGAPYGEIVQQRILDPLGMRATAPVITHDTRRRLAVGYTEFYDDRPPQADRSLVPATWFETGTADGSIASTPADMAIYLRTLMARGQHRGAELVSAAAFRRMIEPVIATGDGVHGESYGYGLTIEEEDGHCLIGHSGGMVGYCCHVLVDLDAGLGVVVMVNGPGKPDLVARWALQVFRAAVDGRGLPELPPPVDPLIVERAADYVGLYGDPPELRVVPQVSGLGLVRGEIEIPLEPVEGDRFFARHPDWDRYPVQFGRQDGVVVELCHGPSWHPHQRYRGPTEWDSPAEWLAYPGHYRAHNPWCINWRVVLRKGELVFLHPTGEEEPLVQVERSLFRAGPDSRSPERLRFDTVVDGHALRANLSGEYYYRTFTP
jgi:D-alanyl-D-alanine carboxypeptidase